MITLPGTAWLHFLTAEMVGTYGVIVSLPATIKVLGGAIIASLKKVPSECGAKVAEELWLEGPLHFGEGGWVSMACPKVKLHGWNRQFPVLMLTNAAIFVLISSRFLALLTSGCCDKSFTSGKYLAFTYRYEQSSIGMLLVYLLMLVMATLPFVLLTHGLADLGEVLFSFLNFKLVTLILSLRRMRPQEPPFCWRSEEFSELDFKRPIRATTFLASNRAISEKVVAMVIRASSEKQAAMRELVSGDHDHEQVFEILMQEEVSEADTQPSRALSPIRRGSWPGIIPLLCTLLVYGALLLYLFDGPVLLDHLLHKPAVEPVKANFTVVGPGGWGLSVGWSANQRKVWTKCMNETRFWTKHIKQHPEASHVLVAGMEVLDLAHLGWPEDVCSEEGQPPAAAWRASLLGE